MKTPLLTAHLPTCASFTAEALAKTLRAFDWQISVAVLSALKEASVRDQNFEQAQTFRAAGSALQQSAIGNRQSAIRDCDKHAGPMENQLDKIAAKQRQTTKRRKPAKDA